MVGCWNSLSRHTKNMEEIMKMVVYKHTCIKTGLSYIGSTIKTMETRWHEHTYKKKYIRGKLYDAIRKYGTDCWTHEILIGNVQTIEELRNFEQYYIKVFDTQKNGYNGHRYNQITNFTVPSKLNISHNSHSYDFIDNLNRLHEL